MEPKKLLSLINLATPESRLGVWAILTIVIYIVPFNWLRHLSLYGHVGWHNAPSIGLTRAYWYVLHGQFISAWHMNYLIFVVLSIGLPLIAIDMIKLKAQLTKTKGV